MFQNTEPLRSCQQKQFSMAFSSFFEVNVHFFQALSAWNCYNFLESMHAGPQTTANSMEFCASRTTHDREPDMLEPQRCKFQGIVPRTKPTQTRETEKGPIPKRGWNAGETWVETWAKRARIWNSWWDGALSPSRCAHIFYWVPSSMCSNFWCSWFYIRSCGSRVRASPILFETLYGAPWKTPTRALQNVHRSTVFAAKSFRNW